MKNSTHAIFHTIIHHVYHIWARDFDDCKGMPGIHSFCLDQFIYSRGGLSITMLASHFNTFIGGRNPAELTVAEPKLWLQERKNSRGQ